MRTAIICGGREFRIDKVYRDMLRELLSNLSVKEVVTGGARGADAAAKDIALGMGLGHKEILAEWGDLSRKPCRVKTNRRGKYNALAGHNRNQEMLDYAKNNCSNPVCIAFPGERGTADMVRRALAASVRVYEIFSEDSDTRRGIRIMEKDGYPQIMMSIDVTSQDL